MCLFRGISIPCLVASDWLHSFAFQAVLLLLAQVEASLSEKGHKNSGPRKPFPHHCSQNTSKMIRGMPEQ